MTKSDLADRLAARMHLTRRQADAIIGIFLASINEALQDGDKVELRGFGSFRVRARKARRGHNPRTGAEVQVVAKKVPHFRPGKVLREIVESGKGP